MLRAPPPFYMCQRMRFFAEAAAAHLAPSAVARARTRGLKHFHVLPSYYYVACGTM